MAATLLPRTKRSGTEFVTYDVPSDLQFDKVTVIADVHPNDEDIFNCIYRMEVYNESTGDWDYIGGCHWEGPLPPQGDRPNPPTFNRTIYLAPFLGKTVRLIELSSRGKGRLQGGLQINVFYF